MKINSPKFRSKIKRVIFLISMWIVAGVYIDIIRYATMTWVLENIPINTGANNIPIEYDFSGILILTILEIVLAGLILAPIEVFYFTDRFKRRSFGYAVLIKSLFYLIGLLLLATLLRYLEYVFSGESYESFLKDLLSESLMLLFIWGPIFLVTNFILQVSDKFGQGVLGKFILGKYHTPKEETRIFMFLDMKSSTTIAEALGNERYFELLKDFFYDVTDAIVETKGEIYQYVGDEIVISWKLKSGVENTNSLNCFFDIYNVVKKYSEKYQSKYDLVPSFKAGMHYGEVTVGEVGVMKREITFSGDVLNTTSRIQELCNKYNEKLIVSKNFLDLMNLKDKFILKEIGQMNLRGRSAPVLLYSVKRE